MRRSEGPDDVGSTYTRRALMLEVGAGALAAGGGVAVASAAWAEPSAASRLLSDDEIYGPGVEVLWALVGDVFDERKMFVVGIPPGGDKLMAIAVGLADGAHVIRDGREVPVTQFERGDEVIMGGAWHPDGFAAAIVEQSYRVLMGTVTGRRGSRLTTTGGPLRLNSETRTMRDAPRGRPGLVPTVRERIRPGDKLWAFGTRQGLKGDLVASRVSVDHRKTRA